MTTAMLSFAILLTLLRPVEPAVAPDAELDLTVRYLFYACDPCPYEYRVESSGTAEGRLLIGKDVAIVYRGKQLGETDAFPAVTTEHNRIRVWGI